MEEEIFFGAAYRGSKKYSQQEVKTADATGFGAAADDYAERGIDLNEQLIRNKPATFFMRVRGDAMVGAGIYDGDIVIVDRSLKAASGKVVIAILNGEMLIRRLEKTFNKIRLLPETAKLSPIEVDTSSNEFAIWGVVTYVIHTPLNLKASHRGKEGNHKDQRRRGVIHSAKIIKMEDLNKLS